MSSQSSTQSWDGYGYPSFGNPIPKRMRPSKTARSALRKYGLRTAIPRPMSTMSSNRTNGVYRMTRKVIVDLTYNVNGIDIAGVSTQGMGFVFTPSSVVAANTSVQGTYGVPNYIDISALWDRVKIEKIVMEVFPKNQDPINNSGNSATPVCYYASDYTDVSNTTLNIIQQQGDCKTWHANSAGTEPLVYTCYPKFQTLVQYTTTLSSFQPQRGYVVSDTAIPHYGIRWAIDNNLIGSGVLNFVFTFHYACKNVK